MKKNYFLKSAATFVVLVASIFSFQVKADAVVIDGIAYKLDDAALTAETAALPSGDKYSGSLVIPANVTNDSKTYAVVKIGEGSLRDAPNLTSVTIPDGMKVIGNSAFASCTALASMTLPASVTTIEDWAFYECSSMASINIPDGIKTIAEHLFQKSGLTSITLPSSVTGLKTCAFQDASKLASINLENITSVGAWSLYGTAIQSVTLSNVGTILSEAFGECPLLETVTLNNVGTVGDWAFKNCPKLKKADLGALASINGGAFSGCSALTSLVIPSSVVYIGNWALEKTTSLTEIYISWENPDETVYIEEYAFGDAEGKANFTWKVPSQYENNYGSSWYGYPVATGTLGINSTLNEDIKVYYNNGILNFTNMAGFNASIISVGGQKIAGFQVNDENGQIPISLAKGVYLLNAKNANNQTTIKFIVK